jgi:hypothetical protein
MQEYRETLSKCVVIVGLMALLAVPAWPQAGNGSVRGTIRDQSNAVIPGAAVKLTNTATNLTS